VNPYRFGGQVGHRRDGTNRNYVRATNLDTQRGRWINQDPIGFGAEDENLYCYSANRDVTFRDPPG
jgi:RHS repeat-associated protein